MEVAEEAAIYVPTGGASSGLGKRYPPTRRKFQHMTPVKGSSHPFVPITTP